MKMIEKVARAMWQAEKYGAFNMSAFKSHQDLVNARLDAYARAAVEALMEPTEGMVEAAGEVLWGGTKEEAEACAKSDKFEIRAESGVAAFRAMLKQVLDE